MIGMKRENDVISIDQLANMLMNLLDCCERLNVDTCGGKQRFSKQDLYKTMEAYRILIQYCPVAVKSKNYQSVYKWFYRAQWLTSKVKGDSEKDAVISHYFDLLKDQKVHKKTFVKIFMHLSL